MVVECHLTKNMNSYIEVASFQMEEMYKKCHANIRANPEVQAKEKKDVKVKRYNCVT